MTFGGFPDLFRLDQSIALLPELNLLHLAVEPAVADNAMLAGFDPGEHAGLHGGGEGGERRPHGPHSTGTTSELGNDRGVFTDEGG